ncbi:UDP-glucose 4-epimerase GalE [Candidatus Saccharibacteria bacterium]|jgi:UDP-glucose 4-epimerase|nr:UDP-glucose 4-epimerase GalE [Candidatus Saccharibacteria bacterium]NCU43944.1 UDP-glucose 4-epimerase GalE [Candidatus Saccharibacteria bacterium]
MSKILVTGGLGFIGSHTVVELIKDNFEVVIVDNLANSNVKTLEKLEKITGSKIPFHKLDVASPETAKIFLEHEIDGIIHFAGLKAVGESVDLPLKYYHNNLLSTINLLELSERFGVDKFIFSSSATVYGDGVSPLRETDALLPTTNPYGETKLMGERIITDYAKNKPNFAAALLRYFNPIGAHESGLIGEVPNGKPNNLMPFITQVAAKKRDKLSIFGNDYDTTDGTGVRDYIHVVDLALGHIAALKNLKPGVNIYNLGTGQGVSVLELVNAFMSVNKIDIPYEIVPRRAGDIAVCYASTAKATQELNFKTKKSTEDMVRDAWNFEKNLS